MKRRGFMGSIAAALTINPTQPIEAVSSNELSPPLVGSVGLGGSEAGIISGGSWAKREAAKINLLRLINPEWFERKRRMMAKHVSRLDIDIASFQSVSVAGKISMQRERNYQTEYMREHDWAQLRDAENEFEAANNFFQL